MFRDFWNTQAERAESVTKALHHEAAHAEKKIAQLIDAVVEASNPRVITAYEQRIEKLECEKLLAQEKLRNGATTPQNFDALFELSIRFLSNPAKLWKTGRFSMQRLVLKLTFAEHLHYCRETGFRTPQTTVPFGFLGSFHLKEKMVPQQGERLNSLSDVFEALKDWEYQLQAENIDFDELMELEPTPEEGPQP